MTTLTLSETAQKHDVAKSSLSEAVHDRRPVHGMNLYRYAVIENGRIKKFDFPSWYCFPDDENDKDEETEETIFMTIKEICRQHSGFHRGKIEEALRQGCPIDGFPVFEWVVRDEEGKWEGFEVPRSAEFDGPHRSDGTSMEESLQEAKRDRLQKDRADKDALSGDESSSKEKEGANKDGPKLGQSLLALAGAAGLSALTSE
ncbi:hypothetical protein GGP86_003242 [Salinibacter ruber]|uniref:hypothetical protein n=1 Tax=Salinibacter ruber TaxID=146919 RepID=UPI0021692A9E|nr:hypothetical protein [Salinibacter ruber]MCS3863443.1 hypothetical protein [Salinibacter ruber]